MDIPKFDQLIRPTFLAIKRLGGSASIDEIINAVIDNLKLSESVVTIPHSETDSRTELEYRMAWARTYLKRSGYIDNSKRGVWALTSKGAEVKDIDSRDVVKTARNAVKEIAKRKQKPEDEISDTDNEFAQWKEEVFKILLELSPDAFERLCQRLLREAGFIQVKVTGRSNDGGIDGAGIIRLGLLSFPVVFQCKRYQGSVSAGVVRDFRGAMEGRAEKGLIITTGSFTRSATDEANRDGARPIDLIDGEKLVELLKEYNIGMKTRTIDAVDVDSNWFSSL